MELTLNNIRETKQQDTALKIVLWIGIASIIMLFGGLTSAYIVRQAEGNWVLFELPVTFYISTALIILSSVTMIWAFSALKRNKRNTSLLALAITFFLGLGFMAFQFMSWDALVKQEIFFIGNPSGSFLYVISGLHLAHVIGGFIFLLVAMIKTYRGKYSANNLTGLSLCSTYWHFLDALWVYLFIFLLIIR
ncbi:MAG: cytochrome c oxidase subunit 3 [Bacteroidia bacterium]